jgi:hypothetical protein
MNRLRLTDTFPATAFSALLTCSSIRAACAGPDQPVLV